MRAWQVHEFGAPTDVLRFDEVDAPEPGPGEVQIAVEAITINSTTSTESAADTGRCESSHRTYPGWRFSAACVRQARGVRG